MTVEDKREFAGSPHRRIALSDRNIAAVTVSSESRKYSIASTFNAALDDDDDDDEENDDEAGMKSLCL